MSPSATAQQRTQRCACRNPDDTANHAEWIARDPLKVSTVTSSHRNVGRAVLVRVFCSSKDRRGRSLQLLPEDAQQRPRGPLIQRQHAAVRHVRVQHGGPVLPGYQQICEPDRAVRLAGGRDHPMAIARTILRPLTCRGTPAVPLVVRRTSGMS
jgi:hypothetical protein